MDPCMQNKSLEHDGFVIENNILRGVTKTKQIDLSRKVGQHIFHLLNEHPEHVSQIEVGTGRQSTFAEMRERSVRCALWMDKEQMIASHDIVVVCTDNHLDSYIPVFATFFLDAVFSAWYYQLTLDTARQLMKQYQPKLIFACKQASDVLVEASTLEKLHTTIVVFEKHWKLQSLDEILSKRQSSKEANEFVPKDVKNLDDLAAVMLSSGTSGQPKGVMLSNRSLLYMVKQDDTNVPTNARLLWYSTLEWLSCLFFMLWCASNRATRIIDSRCDAEHFCRAIEKYEIISTTGAKVQGEVLEMARNRFPSASVREVYALTEVGSVTRFNRQSRLGSNGFICPNYQLKIVDVTTNRTLAANEQGEIIVLSPAPMIGYHGLQAEMTKGCFDEQGWHRTGDLGYYDENGVIFITGRLKDLIMYRNRRVSPLYLEQLLMKHPDVEEVAIVSIPHEIDGDWPAAFVKKIAGSQVSKDELMELTAMLEDHNKLRGGLYFLDCLPRTASGKIKTTELRQLAENLMKQKEMDD